MNEGDAVFNVLISVGIIQYLRRFLQTKTRLPAWDARLVTLWRPAGILLLVYEALQFNFGDHRFQLSHYWVWAITLGLALYTLRLSWSYQPARTLLFSIVPFVVLSAVEETVHALLPGFYKANKEFFSSSYAFSTFWVIAFSVIASRQKKRLANEQAERDAQEARNRLIEATNAELERQVAARTAELTRQKEELLQTVADLKATQEQLVQKEKMASLGELTAGIAHEIQNPLNFVNNFAEVSVELLEELGEELQAGRADDAQDLMSDIRQNLEKINYHGHRADAIVKSMLQHSRSRSDERHPTDLNALADEYLRLSYHGLRAKDSQFNATMVTDFDPALKPVTVAGQEIGRVLLNLFNNAFYAVTERKNQAKVSDTTEQDAYKPTVTVSTHLAVNRVIIRVRDNGTGIPESVKAKIFQPFFTTKPTGEGTGLGLSLSYDIVTKGHGGTLTVESTEGEGTTFIVTLPGQF